MPRLPCLLVILLLFRLLPACGGNSNVRDTDATDTASLPEFETSAQAVASSSSKALAEATALVERVAALQPGEATFENAVGALDTALSVEQTARRRHDLLTYVSPDEKVREQAGASKVALQAWEIDVTSRKDLDAVLRAYAASNPALTGEDRRLLDHTLRLYSRNGLALPEDTQQQIRTLKKELAGQEATILQNYNATSREVTTVAARALTGTPEALLAQYERDGAGDYVVPVGLAYKVTPLLQFCPNEEGRKAVFQGFQTRGALTNKDLMTEVIKKRAKLAALLGYASWADYATEVKMAGTGRHALEFVQGLSDGLEPKFRAEKETLRLLKAAETGNPDARLDVWDLAYFGRILMETRYQLDVEALRPYFNYETVLGGLFRVVEKAFGLKIEFVAAPTVWSPQVRLVRLADAATGKLLGHLYLDMFPRPDQGKFGHFASLPVVSGKLLPDLSYQHPVAALVCNFPEPAPGKPSLLAYGEVKTLFHEFGHALHELLSTSRYTAFSGTYSVPFDFLEVPSTVLENWATDKRVLDQFAVNPLEANDRIPAEVLEKIDAASKAGVALNYRGSLADAKMDLLLHTEIAPESNFDLVEYTNRVLADVYFPFPENSSRITSFGHLFAGLGYDAGYYGYLWAEVIADDLASAFRASPEGFTDEALGLKLRTEVYEVGNSRDVNESVARFLGRPWNNEAFLKKLGLGK